MAYGFVYLLSNDFMPGIYKIGFTMRHPRERVEELSKATACPFPFELLCFFDCEDPEEVEKMIHDELDHCRVNSNREFFAASLHDIYEAFDQHWDACSGVIFDVHFLYQKSLEDEKKERQFLWDHFFSQIADPIEWPKKSEYKALG